MLKFIFLVEHSKSRDTETDGVDVVHFEESIEILGMVLKMLCNRQSTENKDDRFFYFDVEFIEFRDVSDFQAMEDALFDGNHR